jgi:hypothetical protein
MHLHHHPHLLALQLNAQSWDLLPQKQRSSSHHRLVLSNREDRSKTRSFTQMIVMLCRPKTLAKLAGASLRHLFKNVRRDQVLDRARIASRQLKD